MNAARHFAAIVRMVFEVFAPRNVASCIDDKAGAMAGVARKHDRECEAQWGGYATCLPGCENDDAFRKRLIAGMTKD